jgi:ABC-type transport system involved in multi-copper enzyme maturation permease subunit
MLFGALIFEREPLHWEYIWFYLFYWIQVFGGFAAAGAVLWCIFGLPRMRREDLESVPRWKRLTFTVCMIVGCLAYLPILLLYTNDAFASLRTMQSGGTPPILRTDAQMRAYLQTEFWSLTIGGLAALIAVLMPFVANLTRLRWRRVYAIAKLSFKEAVRRRVLYGFALLLLVFLFGTWFVRSKSEDQVRTYVLLVNFAMAVLLLFTAAVLSSFSIPADMRQQTIHTITTKPVERFEIVLGRFLGFTALMTVVLFVMSTVCLLYVLREINPEAARESLKARAPLYGNLVFENTKSRTHGENVGVEWEYRGYIGYAPSDPPTAIWAFPMPPRSTASRKEVPCEFNFSVYRTTKGEEYRGVSCKFAFLSADFQPANAQSYTNQLDKKLFYRTLTEQKIREDLARDVVLAADKAKLDARVKEEMEDRERSPEEIKDRLAERYGYYESTVQVSNAHTLAVPVPGGFFRKVLETPARADAPPLTVRVTCVSPTQYVGMARYDLYFRLDDESSGTDRFWFAVNFYKGALGLWMRLCLIVGLAVSLSTYLSGVISLLIALLLFLGGENRDFIYQVGAGLTPGGGPAESLLRTFTRQNLITKLDDSTVKTVVTYSDIVFRGIIRRVLDIIPDTQRLTLTPYVAEGFNIGFDSLVLSFLVLLGYLIPCFVLAYYLIEWREIAGPM